MSFFSSTRRQIRFSWFGFITARGDLSRHRIFSRLIGYTAEINCRNETERRESLIRRAYAAFNARDIDAALATMQANVEWPNGMEGGYVHGHDEIRAYWTRQWGMVDPHVAPLGMITSADGRMVVEVRQAVRDLGGALLMDGVVQHVYLFDGDLIAHMEIIA